jgi:hypothetical protein
MCPSVPRGVLTAAAFLALAAPASPQGSGRCTSETLAIDGQRVAATFCVTDSTAKPGKGVRVTLSETLAGTGGSLKRASTLDFVVDDPARAIDDIPLAQLGIKKTLHATFIYAAGNVRLEHALLVPGAVTVK